MGKKWNIAVIGAGGIATFAHAPAWAANEEANMTAVCDIDREKEERFAEKFGIAQVFTDYRELLEQDHIDAVDICTPNVYHSEITTQATSIISSTCCKDGLSRSSCRSKAWT